MKDDKALWELICKPIEGFPDFPKRPSNNESPAEKAMLYLTGGKALYYGSFVPSDAKPPQEKPKKKENRSGAAKDFVALGVDCFKKEHGGYPERLSQLLMFAKSKPNAVQGYVITDVGGGNNRRIYFSIPNSHRESATYQGIHGAYGLWKSKNSRDLT